MKRRDFLKSTGAGFFSAFNRTKKSVTIDLSTQPGVAAVRKLVAAADVFLENFRPGAFEAKGLGYEALSKENPRLVYCSLKGFLQFGAIPTVDTFVDVAPVDYVAKAIVHMALHKNPLGRAFHLTNPGRLHVSQALTLLRSRGYQFTEQRFVELRDQLVNNGNFAANALFVYQSVLEDMDDISLQLPTYDTREVQRELQGSGIACAPADEKLFGLYLDYLQDIGYLPRPERAPALS